MRGHQEYHPEEIAEMKKHLAKIGENGKIRKEDAKEMADLFNSCIWGGETIRNETGVWWKLYRLKTPSKTKRRSATPEVARNDDNQKFVAPITDSLEELVCGFVRQAKAVSETSAKLAKLAMEIKIAFEQDKQRLKAYTKIREIVEREVPEILKKR